MVINVGLVRSGDLEAAEAEVRAVREAAPSPVVLKVIIESAALTDEQIVGACQAAERAGADFVKTSTGFHPAGGASEHAVTLMRRTVGDRLGAKPPGASAPGRPPRRWSPPVPRDWVCPPRGPSSRAAPAPGTDPGAECRPRAGPSSGPPQRLSQILGQL